MAEHAGAFYRCAKEYKEMVVIAINGSGGPQFLGLRPLLYNLKHALELAIKAILIQDNALEKHHVIDVLFSKVRSYIADIFDENVSAYCETIFGELQKLDFDGTKHYDLRYPDFKKNQYHLNTHTEVDEVMLAVEIVMFAAASLIDHKTQFEALSATVISQYGTETRVTLYKKLVKERVEKRES